jgi:hypothetical protein
VKLESLIATLERMPMDAPVKILGGNAGWLMSYRGYYDQLALGTGTEVRTVVEVLDDCRSAIGRTFEGYKGGNFTMRPHTPVWADEYGQYSSNAIVGVALADGVVEIAHLCIEDYA